MTRRGVFAIVRLIAIIVVGISLGASVGGGADIALISLLAVAFVFALLLPSDF